MEIKTITLLSAEEYEKCKTIIPQTSWWWLKTPYLNDKVPYFDDNDCVRVVFDNVLDYNACDFNHAGVRPVGIFNIELTSPMFWHKSEALIGTKMQYGNYNWTIFNIQNGELYALCDKNIAKRRFDSTSNVWESSELKTWLETEGVKLITT